MAKITFDTDDYYDDDTLLEMIQYETRDTIRRKVNQVLERNDAVSEIIESVAMKETESMLDDVIQNYKSEISNKIDKVVNDLNKYDILYHSKATCKIIDDAVEEIEPIIREKARKIAIDMIGEKVNTSQIIDAVCDEFYNILSNQLMENRNGM